VRLVTLYVVRHAHAGRRSNWTGDDRTRPLSDRGELQAKSILATIDGGRSRGSAPRTLASPALRCVQTVQPLASQLGGEVVEDVRLFEGADRDDISSLLSDVAGTSEGDEDTVVCSHGDVIPIMLELLVDAGMAPERNLVWQKASMWVIDRSDGRWGTGRYLPPPDRA
jgi:broad specificity phosphatase PhoE